MLRKIQHLLWNNTINPLLCDVYGHSFFQSMCSKINAHGVVMLLVRLSEDGTPNLFKPWLMSSQPCVPYFKCAWCSFTSVGSTQLTFTWFDFLIHRCRKADSHIRLTGLGSTDNIVYPRHIKNQVRYGNFSTETYVSDTLPSVEGI